MSDESNWLRRAATSPPWAVWIRSWIRFVRCPACRCWWNRHDPLILHGDGVTDDTQAIQYAIDHNLPLPPNRNMRTKKGCLWCGRTGDLTKVPTRNGWTHLICKTCQKALAELEGEKP